MQGIFEKYSPKTFGGGFFKNPEGLVLAV